MRISDWSSDVCSSDLDETPEGFVFSAKAPKRIMASKVLAKAGVQVEDFIRGIVELGDRLGPLVWHFDTCTQIEADDLPAFPVTLHNQPRGRAHRHLLDAPVSDHIHAPYPCPPS